MEYTIGNIKIWKDTLILNMTSATDCISAKMGLCDIVASGNMWACYAYRPEQFRPDCLPYRRRQNEQWDMEPVEVIASQLNKAITSTRRKEPIKWVRYSESGDFRHQADVNKMSALADLLRVPLYGYTARHDLDYSAKSCNMTVNGSGFMVDNEFTAVPEITSRIVCQGSCRHCHMCKRPHGITIEAKLH